MKRRKINPNALPLLGHLKVLRKVLLVIVYAVMGGALVGFFVSQYVVSFIQTPALGFSEVSFVALSPLEILMVRLKLSVVIGVFLVLPIIFWQLWSFLLPALKRTEKKYLYSVVPWSIGLFLAGSAFCYFFVLPLSLNFFVSMGQESVKTELMYSMSTYVDFVLKFVLSFGLIFELPVVLLMLIKLGILSPQALIKFRKYALFFIVVAAVIISPTPDLWTIMFMVTPMYLLYEVSIRLGKRLVKGQSGDAVPANGKRVIRRAAVLVLAAGLVGGGAYWWVSEYMGVAVIHPGQGSVSGAFNGGLVQVTEGDKYGYVDGEGTPVVPAAYDAGTGFIPKHDWLWVVRDGKGGVCDLQGNVLVPLEFDEYADVGEGLIKVRKGEKWGTVGTNGMVLPVEYDEVGGFSDGLALVRQGEETGYIDAAGVFVIPLSQRETGIYSEGLLSVKEEDKFGYLNAQGYVAIPLELEYDHVDGFLNGLARVEKDGKIGFIDRSGKEVIPVYYNESESLPFLNGCCWVSWNGKWGLIDSGGNAIRPFEYDEIDTGSYRGVCRVGKDGRYGLVDGNDGRVLLPAEYEFAGKISEGLIWVRQDGKWGCVDADGQMAIPLELFYDDVGEFHDGLACVSKNGKWGFIDTQGGEVVALQYDAVTEFSGGRATALLDNAWVILKKNELPDFLKTSEFLGIFDFLKNI